METFTQLLEIAKNKGITEVDLDGAIYDIFDRIASRVTNDCDESEVDDVLDSYSQKASLVNNQGLQLLTTDRYFWEHMVT